MLPKFNMDLDNLLSKKSPVNLNLGCGLNKQKGFIGIDFLDLPGVDIVADLEGGLPFLPADSIDYIYSRSLFEHISHLDILMRECWRILKPNGRMELYVPHFSNPYYYSDYTHKRFFGLYSFEYFSKNQNRFKRKVPAFYHDYSFSTRELYLHFNSLFLFGRIFRMIAMNIINIHPILQEFYEESCCYILPCSAIRVVLEPDK